MKMNLLSIYLNANSMQLLIKLTDFFISSSVRSFCISRLKKVRDLIIATACLLSNLTFWAKN